MQTKRPSDRAIRNLAETINNRLFKLKYDNQAIKYNSQDIIKLLNLVSCIEEIPAELKCNWGYAIISMTTMKEAFNTFGTRGNKLQQQNKQTMTSSVIVVDNNDNVVNKQMIKFMIPQTTNPAKNAFLNKCKQIRKDFNSNNTNILCINKTTSRMS